ncbi:MAG: cytochrome c3 family protein [Clostridiales bacterium]|jgi:predicted CXXCH cytochrome family protein|nr:cytochrome c3 family protein [Clostridiales bacterium]
MGRPDGFRKLAGLVLGFAFVLNVGFVLAGGIWEKPARVDLEAEGFINANRTGIYDTGRFDGYLRSVQGQSVHREFTLNSNSCASCHLTHVSPAGKLLFQRSIYNTCTTCHFDNTMNAYNVLEGLMPGGGAAGGGRFFDDDFIVSGREGVSYHEATGRLEHWQAPGSGITAEEADALRLDQPDSPWLQSFTCGSCHAPHGSYSGRHLHYDPNGWVAQQERLTADLVAVPGEPGKYAIEDKTLTPWYYSEDTAYGVVVNGIVNGQPEDVTNLFAVNHAEGSVKKLDPDEPVEPVSVSFYRVKQIEVSVVNPLEQDEFVIYQKNTVEFCLSCHIQYGEETESGRYTAHKRFYHAIGTDIRGKILYEESAKSAMRLEVDGSGEYRLTCLTCHFAHGTDTEMMQRRDWSWSIDGGLRDLSLYTGAAPENTVHLRYFDPENDDGFGGRFEACYLCHGEFLYEPAVTGSMPDDNGIVGEELDMVAVYFNIGLYEPSVLATTMTVTDSVYGNEVSGTPVYSAETRSVHLAVPAGWLQAGREYIVRLTAGIRAIISHRAVEVDDHQGHSFGFSVE